MRITPSLKLSIVALMMFSSFFSLAQSNTLIYNNGAMFYINGGVSDSAIVWVDGTVVNNDSVLVNKGKFIIKGDYINNDQSGGNSIIPSIPGHDGLMILDGNWENNGIHFPGSGRVIMKEDGMITGSSETTFHDLELVGSIKRTMTINAWINQTGTLTLDSAELATDVDTLFISNPNVNAISRADCDDCGFVSSLGNGNMSRVTNLPSEYLFPVGSSVTGGGSSLKYRPVIITPEGSAIDSFSVRMVNNTYVPDFFTNILDFDICYLNQEFYHRINQLGGGNASADMGIFSSIADGDEGFNMVGRRDDAPGFWRRIGGAATGTAGTFEKTTQQDWTDFNATPEDAYVLGREFPQPPTVIGDNQMCAFFEATYNVPENGSDYTFFVSPDQGTIINETDYSVTVQWNDVPQGILSVTESIPNGINNGCESAPQLYAVSIFPQPVAIFDYTLEDLPGGVFVYDLVGFNDSSINANSWSWDFGDGFSHSDQNPFHTYDNIGQFDVTLTVVSGNDCIDDTTVTLNVVEGVIVPNVFTPNGDLSNDTWDVRTSDVGDYHVAIYNRWGTLIFETTTPQVSWNGTTNAGVEAPAGVYYFYIDKIALSSGTEVVDNGDNIQFKETGYVQLIR